MVTNIEQVFSRFNLGNTNTRNLYEVLGYSNTFTHKDYYHKYRRQDIARRVVDAYPEAVWSKYPTVHEDGNKEINSPFEKQVYDFFLDRRLYNTLNRLDKLLGMGRYALLYIGVSSVKSQDDLLKELKPESLTGPNDILYFHPYGEHNVSGIEYEEDQFSGRYSLPKFYNISPSSSPDTDNKQTGFKVHHSRIIHVAESTMESPIFGRPRLECIMNRLEDLDKVVGGSAEIFWLNGRGGLNLALHPEADSTEEDLERIDKEAQEYLGNLRRFLKTRDIDVKTLELQVANPKFHFDIIIELISGATGIPQRVLLGSERGQLASQQDEKNWESRVLERIKNFCEPFVLRALVDRMIELGVFRKPSNRYEIDWHRNISLSPREVSDNAFSLGRSIAQYVNSPGAEFVVPPKQFVQEILKIPYKEEEINKMMENPVIAGMDFFDENEDNDDK